MLDWGLAAEMITGPDGKRRLTRPVSKGTPGFMSPEQIVGGTELDERADIYSLGALLYAMLTLHNPLSGEDAGHALEAAMQDRVPLPSEAYPERDIPAALEAVVQKAMAYRPQDRYASVKDLRADVVSFQAGFAPQAENASAIRKLALFINRNFVVTVLLGIIAVLSAVLVFVLQ